MIERHLVAVESTSPLTQTNIGALLEAARQTAGHLRTGRLARTRHLAERCANRLAAIDRALAARIALDCVPVEAQPGLFDAREARSFEAARLAGLAVDEELAVRLDRHSEQAAVDAGRPVLELILLVGAP